MAFGGETLTGAFSYSTNTDRGSPSTKNTIKCTEIKEAAFTQADMNTQVVHFVFLVALCV